MNETTKSMQSYPESRYDYTRRTGWIGEYVSREICEDAGYNVKDHNLNSRGADIDLGEIGIEVWNHSTAHSYARRKKSVIRNLGNFRHRFLLASFISQESKKRVEEAYPGNPIRVIETGFQIVPIDYEPYYIGKRQTTGRKFYNRRTLKTLRNLLVPYLRRTNRTSYVYCTDRNNPFIYYDYYPILDNTWCNIKTKFELIGIMSFDVKPSYKAYEKPYPLNVLVERSNGPILRRGNKPKRQRNKMCIVWQIEPPAYFSGISNLGVTFIDMILRNWLYSLLIGCFLVPCQ